MPSTRGLTLPSSGPAYGRPLKSNVRPRTKPDHGSRSAARYAARAIAQNKACRRRFEFCALAQGCGQDRRGLSVIRRPAHGRIASKAREFTAPVQAFTVLRQSTEPCVGRIASLAKTRSIPSVPSLSLSLSSRTNTVAAHPALVCFAIQIQGTAPSPRARPNPSFKRTRLRRSAYVKR